jgi:tRNA(Ile)-lysidine synthase
MSEEPTIVRRVREFFAPHRPLPGPIVVAVSGGPDSVALLRALRAVHDGPLVVAHLNHGFRGAEADADQQFVRELARDVGVEFECARRDVSSAAAGKNWEAAARRVRYDWLTSVALTVGSGWVATGHTADDQAETVLFQLLRGTGLDGMAGIARRRRLADSVELVRPQLAATRGDVLAFLRGLGQEVREDSTNADTKRTRSRIRHQLLPRLVTEYNPRLVEVLARLAAQAADWRRDRATAVAALLEQAERPRAGPLLVFDRQRLARDLRSSRRLLWRLVWRREGWPRLAMGFREWDRLAGMSRGGPAAIDLPGGIRARRRGDVIQVGPSGGL